MPEPPAVYGLLRPCGGLFQQVNRFRTECDEPRISTVIVQAGDIRQLWPHLNSLDARVAARVNLSGAATGIGDEEALLPALVEGLERYCACVFSPDHFVWTTARELGSEAMDLDMIPRCSPEELSHSRCPLVAPDKTARIRWVRGLSLLNGKTVYAPAVMTYLYAGFASREERICVPISTGCAGHISYERALLNGILEVVERDAISLVWLQKISLPRLEVDTLPISLAPYWERCQNAAGHGDLHLFDATTDLGVPTVFGVQISPLSTQTTMVACSAALDPAVAVAKVLRDMAACRIGFRRHRPFPESWDDFNDISHGATYMADIQRLPAFDFLLKSKDKRLLSQMSPHENADEKKSLQAVLKILERKRFGVYVIDLSTDEAIRLGVRVVRVLIPQLQPLGFNYRARYLGHPRLYDAPRQMGYPTLAEAQLNYWPLPFA